VLTVSVSRADQVSPELLARKPALLYLPADQCAAHPELLEQCRQAEVPVAALLPRICSDQEGQALVATLEALRGQGVEEVLAGNLGSAHLALQLGLRVRGDFGLGVYNSQTIKELKRLGFVSAAASFELKLPQIRDLSKAIPLELIAYGRLPLMITENCIIHNHTGEHTCGGEHQLTDRKGERFPVVQAPGCRNEILNAKTLFLADKAADWSRLGLWAARLMFTTEPAPECVRALERYQTKTSYQPAAYTRGLYYRDVD
jgi:putative protease